MELVETRREEAWTGGECVCMSVCLPLYVVNIQIVINMKEGDKQPGDRECGGTWATEAAGVSGSAHLGVWCLGDGQATAS